MDFSLDYLSRFEEQVKSDRKALEEKSKIIDTIRAETNKTLSLKDNTIEAQKKRYSRSRESSI